MVQRRRRLRVKPKAEEQEELEEVENLLDAVESGELQVDDAEEDVDDTPIRQARRILRKGETPKDEGPKEEIIKPEPLPPAGKVVFSTDPMTDVLDDLAVGHAVVITREDKERFSMRVLETNEFSATPVISYTEYLDIVYSDEYKEFEKEWGAMDADERIAYAKKHKIKWEEHDTHRINLMRVTQAVREHRGIEKFKPEWNTKAKRSKIRPKN